MARTWPCIGLESPAVPSLPLLCIGSGSPRYPDEMTGRRSCPVCGTVYHIENLKPKVEGRCDKGCGELVQRKDDTPEVVSNRLKIYHEQTAAVVGYYQRKGNRILDVDANQDIDEVTADVFGKLEALKG